MSEELLSIDELTESQRIQVQRVLEHVDTSATLIAFVGLPAGVPVEDEDSQMNLTDRGIHKTQEDVWEEELKAAGWKPAAVHPRSSIWYSPYGEPFPGPGYAFSIMKALADKYKNGSCSSCCSNK